MSGSLSITAMLDFSGNANTSIHGLGEDDTASLMLGQRRRRWANIIPVLVYCLVFAGMNNYGVIQEQIICQPAKRVMCFHS